MLENPRGIPGLHAPVIVSGPGYLYCGEGEHVVVEGRYMAPDALFNTAFLDGARIVKCGL